MRWLPNSQSVSVSATGLFSADGALTLPCWFSLTLLSCSFLAHFFLIHLWLIQNAHHGLSLYEEGPGSWAFLQFSWNEFTPGGTTISSCSFAWMSVSISMAFPLKRPCETVVPSRSEGGCR